MYMKIYQLTHSCRCCNALLFTYFIYIFFAISISFSSFVSTAYFSSSPSSAYHGYFHALVVFAFIYVDKYWLSAGGLHEYLECVCVFACRCLFAFFMACH